MAHNKSSRFYGVFSFVLIDLSIVISLYSIALVSLVHSAIYFFGSTISALSIIFIYCTKCTCKTTCSHVVPGLLTQLFRNRDKLAYRIIDYIGITLAGIFIIAYPQVWLWKNKVLFTGFWILLIAAVIQIRLFVCSNCHNKKCAMCKIPQSYFE